MVQTRTPRALEGPKIVAGGEAGDVKNRAWVFRTVGYGHGDDFWKPFISMLRLYDYDGVISIEHEDSLMSMGEGFEKAVSYLKGVLLKDATGGAWWF